MTDGEIGHDIALHGDIRQVLLFSITAALILLIACVNFVNLSTARAMRRAGEVGVRKVMGAHRRQLIGQFMGESIITAIAAVILAGVLAWLMVPPFRATIGSGISVHVRDAGFIAAAALVLAAAVGVIAGSYPELYISSFRPVQALGSRRASAGGALRKVLVVFQFAVSVFLIVATAAIHGQLEFVRNARLGFEPDQTLVIPLSGEFEDRADVAKERVGGLPGVRQVSAAGTIPGRPVSDYLYRPEGWPDEDLRGWDTFFVDDDYVDVLGMTVVHGRDFDASRPSDSAAFLINETAWEEIRTAVGEAWDNPIGKTLDFYVPGREGWEVRKTGRVVGVVKDFNYLSLHTSIDPVILHMMPSANDLLLAKVGTEDIGTTIEALQGEWKALAGSMPLEHFFLDDSFDQQYRAEVRMGQLAGVFAGLAVLIAAMGLFGLATFMTERRTKEIGIRKVLGASVASIVFTLSTEFVKLVLLAFVVAAPVAYWAVNSWLDNFAYRIEPSVLLFTVAGAAAMCIAMLSVGYQAVRAATRDPVRSLRYE